jgi:hypothetical protein
MAPERAPFVDSAGASTLDDPALDDRAAASALAAGGAMGAPHQSQTAAELPSVRTKHSTPHDGHVAIITSLTMVEEKNESNREKSRTQCPS